MQQILWQTYCGAGEMLGATQRGYILPWNNLEQISSQNIKLLNTKTP